MPRDRYGNKVSPKSFRKSIDTYTPKSGGGPSIGPGGNLAASLRPHVPDGGQVSVENNAHPHCGHHDATLYQREGGKFTQIDKAHLGNNGK